MPTAFEPQLLSDLAEPFWAAELAIVRTYFESERRSPETDRLWLRRQCYKEIWGSGIGDRDRGLFQASVASLASSFPRIDKDIDRRDVLRIIDGLRSEFAHYCLFADIHDSLGAKLDVTQLEGWESDDQLARLRYECRDRFGPLGDSIVRFTEGGGGSLFRAGMMLEGRSELDSRIAHACKQVYRDEADHLSTGLADIGRVGVPVDQVDEVLESTQLILQQRLVMRNEQFGFPVPDHRLHRPEPRRATGR